MPSENYRIIRAAMEARQQIVCEYQGYERLLCPHCIGYGKNGGEQMLAFQFAGGSSKGLPPGGQWRCMDVRQMRSVQAREGEWHTGPRHLAPQTCVKEIDLEIYG